MRLVWLSVLSMDAMFCPVVDEFLAHVLAALVIPCSLDAEAQGILSICLVRFEGPKCVALLPEIGQSPETRCIAHKDHPVLVALWGANWELALEVCVDKGDASELPGGKARDGVAIELASKAWLANAVRGTLGADFETQDEVLSHHRAQVVEIDV